MNKQILSLYKQILSLYKQFKFSKTIFVDLMEDLKDLFFKMLNWLYKEEIGV